MLNVFVGAANVADVKAAPVALVPILEIHDRIKKILASQACRGWLVEVIESVYAWILEITQKL